MQTRLLLSIARNLLPLTRYPYQGRERPCPVCGGEKLSTVSRFDRRMKILATAMCERCGLFCTNPMPTEDELERYYRSYYRFDYQWSTAEPSEHHRGKQRKKAQKRLANVIDLMQPDARTLDFGAGSGEFVAAMADAGFDAHGFEPGETYGHFAQRQLGERVRVAGWREVEYDETFDLVSSFHVLEHLTDPVAAMRRAAQWLKPGGLFYIEVPDMVAAFGQKGMGAFHFAHVVGFNEANLRLAAALAGFTPVRSASPTGIVFAKSAPAANIHALEEEGRWRTQALLNSATAGRRFVRHSLSKIGLATRAVRGERASA